MKAASQPSDSDTELQIDSPKEMTALADEFAQCLRVGDLIILDGDLGAGKTFFVSAVGKKLGVAADITSPTFTIANSYAANGYLLHHLDIYRLDSVGDLLNRLDLDDMLDDGVVMIEWGSRIIDYLVTTYESKIVHIVISSEDVALDSETARSVKISTYHQTMTKRFRSVLGGLDG